MERIAAILTNSPPAEKSCSRQFLLSLTSTLPLRFKVEPHIFPKFSIYLSSTRMPAGPESWPSLVPKYPKADCAPCSLPSRFTVYTYNSIDPLVPDLKCSGHMIGSKNAYLWQAIVRNVELRACRRRSEIPAHVNEARIRNRRKSHQHLETVLALVNSFIILMMTGSSLAHQ